MNKRLSDSRFVSKLGPTHTISQQVGNCYTGAVYMNLLSLVSNVGAGLVGKKVRGGHPRRRCAPVVGETGARGTAERSGGMVAAQVATALALLAA